MKKCTNRKWIVGLPLMRKQLRFASFLLFLCLVFPALLFAEKKDLKNAVQVGIVGDKSSVSGGDALYVAVRFQLEDGWHIYGKESEGIGLPTRVRFTLPNGFRGSDIIWPKEEAFLLPGDLKASGYSGDVLIVQEIDVPDELKAGDTFTVTADVDWLLCSEKVCVPGKTTETYEFVSGDSKESESRQLFKEFY